MTLNFNCSSAEQIVESSEALFNLAARVAYTYILIANNFKHIHLNVVGRHFDRVHGLADSYYQHFQEQSDFWFELAMEGLDGLDNPTNAPSHAEVPTLTEQNYDYDTACNSMKEQLETAISAITQLRSQATNATDIQSDCDSELSYLNKEYSYFMRRRCTQSEIR